MSSVIPKLKIDVEALHTARRKIQSKQDELELSTEEREALLSLISAGKKKLYPDKMSMDRYQYHIDQLAKIDPEEKPGMFDRFLEHIEEFQQKYCT